MLTEAQKNSITQHFLIWSGGFPPHGCTLCGDPSHTDIERYVTHARDANLDEELVREFLVEWSEK